MSKKRKVGFGLSSERCRRGSKFNLSTSKKQAFMRGSQVKSKFQKAKELQESKRRQAELDVAAVYASFSASFKDSGPKDKKVSVFVRGGSTQAGVLNKAIDKKDSKYVLKRSSVASDSTRSTQKLDETPNTLVRTAPEVKSRRTLDNLLEEFKAEKAVEKAVETDPDFHKNIFIRRIDPDSTEEIIYDVFDEYGDVKSVKVMWPRTDKERSRGYNTAFVRFNTRTSAEAAFYGLNGSKRLGRILNLCWVKPRKSNAYSSEYSRPGKEHTQISGVRSSTIQQTNLNPSSISLGSNITSESNTSNINLESNTIDGVSNPSEQITTSHVDRIAAIAAMMVKTHSDESCDDQKNPNKFSNSIVCGIPSQNVGINVAIMVSRPRDERKASIIEHLANFVASDGEKFESEIIRQEFPRHLAAINNSETGSNDFDFLFNIGSEANLFYRWCVFSKTIRNVKSCVGGDVMKKNDNNSYEDKPMEMFCNQCVWIPPQDCNNNNIKSKCRTSDKM